jgi:hypothetical protein
VEKSVSRIDTVYKNKSFGTYNNDEYTNEEIKVVQEKLMTFQKQHASYDSCCTTDRYCLINKLMMEYTTIQEEVEQPQAKYLSYAESHPKSYYCINRTRFVNGSFY